MSNDQEQKLLNWWLEKLSRPSLSVDERHLALVTLGKMARGEYRDQRSVITAAIAPFLNDEQVELRNQALFVLGVTLGLREYRDLAVERLSDPERAIRIGAIQAVLTLYEDTQDQDILRRLAGIVCDEREDENLRGQAYRGMRSVWHNDRDEFWDLAFQASLENMTVDWAWVDRFLP